MEQVPSYLEYLILLTILAYSSCAQSDGIPERIASKEAELTKKITSIAQLDHQARPPFNTSGPFYVDVRAHLVHVLNVDSKQQSFSISAFLEVTWMHQNLRWNPEAFGGVKKIMVNGRNLWIPDIGLLNSMDGDFDFASKRDEIHIMVFNTGQLKWYPGGIYHVGCHLNLVYFPFDTQKCAFYFISWAYSYYELILVPRKATMDVVDFMSVSEWEVQNVSVSSYPAYFQPGLESSKWSVLKVEITCVREPGYYITNVIVPAIIISLLVLTVFLLPCDSGEKVSLGVTVLVAFTVFMLVIADTMPKNSKETPYLVLYLTTLMGTTAVTTLMSVMVLNIHHTGSEAKFSPTIRYLIFNVLGRLTHYCRCSPADQESRFTDGVCAEENQVTKLGTLKNPSDLTEENHGNREVLRLLECILQETKTMNDRKENKDKDESVTNEWKEAARIVDRFLMLVYFIVIFVITLVYIVILPMGNENSVHSRRV